MAFEAEHTRLFYPGGPSLLLLPSPWLTVSSLFCHRLICLGATLLSLAHSALCSQSHRRRQSRIGFFHFVLKAGKTLRSVSGTRCPGAIMLIESTPSCIKQPNGVPMTMSTGFRAESWPALALALVGSAPGNVGKLTWRSY